MKIAHISDLHICSEYLPQNLDKTEFLIRMALQKNIDHLVITGDISHRSLPMDYHMFRELLIKYGFYTPDKVTLVFGNHDIYGGVHLFEEIYHFLDQCKKINPLSKVNHLGRVLASSFAGTTRFDKNNFFPFVKIVGPVLFLGLDSTAPYSYLKNPAASNGLIQNKDFALLKHILLNKDYKDYRKIILIHHHLFSCKNSKKPCTGNITDFIERQIMKLHQRKKLIHYLKKYPVDFVLHGHIHYNSLYHIGKTPVFCAGGSIEDEIDQMMKLNIINIENGRIKAWTESFYNEQFTKEIPRTAEHKHSTHPSKMYAY
ncbi:MAG: metallophosphoesterase [Calditrichaceae bacterium]|nr:metallophosphoesterase [Calditrichaceae bacterium]MBN2707552.1 metallophosphoesterase [Calditrichaceae bacterium]RQV95637.1 MAG: metallophosphoesterase [Calditrichota bacterium]